MDVVYTLSNNYAGEELRYSLRSLANLPHDKVFFVGGCPKWEQGVIHIPTEQKGTKYKNTTNNLKIACYDPRLSDDFIYMNDDFFILQPTRPDDLNFNCGTVESVLEILFKKKRYTTPYMSGAEKTRDLLRFNGVPEPLSYELHIPFIFNKSKFLDMFNLQGIDNIACLHKRTLYGNLYNKRGEYMKDVKVFNSGGFLGKTGRFLSCSNNGFPIIENFLKKQFPNKCAYEI